MAATAEQQTIDDRSVARLAQFYNVNKALFKHALITLLPLVRREQAKRKCDLKTAWDSVLDDLEPWLRQRLQIEKHVDPVIIGWMGSIISSSGAEQGFTKCMRALGHLQDRADDYLQFCFVKMLSDASTNDNECDEVIRLAQKVWTTEHGMARTGSKTYTLTNKRPCKDNSEAHVFKRRRLDLPFQVGRDYSADIDSTFGAAARVAMRPEHVSELSFANDKLEKRRLQALREGFLLSDEYDASDKLAADQQLQTIIDEAGKREKSYKRIQRNLRGSAMPTEAELRGKTCVCCIRLSDLRATLA